jgi:hypothetical protein
MAGEKKIPGGWKPDGTGIILDLNEHVGVNAPDTKRLMISSQQAGDNLVKWLQDNGYGVADE